MEELIDKLKGRVKKIVGWTSGDRSLEVKGEATEASTACVDPPFHEEVYRAS